ncbi:lysine--tRNA ligase [Clavibacter sp.]|nr:lysine--tRNA ligase [Clavibacter sp.]
MVRLIGTMSENDLPEQLRIRREKRESLLGRGIAPYPVSVNRTASLKEIRERFKDLATDSPSGVIESVAGRIILNAIPESYVLQLFAKVMAQSYKQCFR